MEENVEFLIQEAVEAAGVNADLDIVIENDLNDLANIQQIHVPVSPHVQSNEAGVPAPTVSTNDSVIIVDQEEHNREFAHSIREAASLITTYNKCLKLIELSATENFNAWEKLRSHVEKIAQHSRASEIMKMRCFVINQDNVRTFNLLQECFQLDLNNVYYMGKMNLLHISCDAGWNNLSKELLFGHGVNVNMCCPSLHMRPASLTPLMLAAGAGHVKVVEVLLSHKDIDLELKDSYGFTAIFHTTNHGFHRVGDSHGYFRRLWSWDLSQQQLDEMENLARTNSLPILKLLIRNGADLFERDKTGASILTRAASVDRFSEVIHFLVETGCKVTENVLNWTKIRNPDVVNKIEEALKVPGTLRRQCRVKIWKLLRSGDKSVSFHTRLDRLVSDECLPNILSDYLHCIS